MKTAKRYLCVLLVLSLLLSSVPGMVLAADSGVPFTDVKETDWFYPAVTYVSANGMMGGTGNNRFSPEAITTRGMIVTILYRLEGAPAGSTGTFADVEAEAYYADGVAWAAANGVVTGYGNGLFGPEDPITREQMASILYRYAQYKAYDTTGAGDVTAFADGAAVSSYAVEAMNWAVGVGLLSGVGNNQLDPAGSATRAQAATLLMRFCQLNGLAEAETYTVTFDYNYEDKGTYQTATVRAGEPVSQPANPTRSGYTFTGWYTQAAGGALFRFDEAVTEDITLYAHWSAISGGSGKPDLPDVPDVPEDPEDPEDPETPEDPENPDAMCDVQFESNGGSAVETMTVKAGETLSAPDEPQREGYIFVGWYLEDTFENQFLFDEEEVQADMTLYADWVLNDVDALLVDYVAQQLTIGYGQGDNAGHVTQDVLLPTEVEEVEDISVVWSSSSDAITATGSVTRPDGADETVTLTAKVSRGSAEAEAVFTLRVIHVRDRDVAAIPNYNVLDIEAMNPDGEVEFAYNDEKTQVISIDGQYSTIRVENADDALDVIESVHTVVGLDDPYEELELVQTQFDTYGAEYTFAQTYNGYEVLGRRITVSVDDQGTTDSLSSGVCMSDMLEQASTGSISADTAATAAVAAYGGSCTAAAEETELVYYALDALMYNPTPAYVVRVYGVDEAGEYADDTVIVNAETSEVITAYDNAYAGTISSKTGSGKTEQGSKVSFPVIFTWFDFYFYYMKDLSRNIQMYDKSTNSRIGSEFNWWLDRTAISAYTNIIKTYDWYKNTLGRKSIDGSGMQLQVVVHNGTMKNNAFWSGSNRTINFCDNSWGSDAENSTAAALDVTAHEYTHGVVQYVTGGLRYQDAPGAINEGYADIFGCLVEGDWEIGEDWITIRDAANPTAYEAPDKMSSPYYIDFTTNSTDNGGVHTNSSLVYHAAYLMERYGLSRTTLAKLWYKSLSMGYDDTSTFETVRRNVLKAGKKLNLSDTQIAAIKRAFDEVEIFGARGDLELTISDTSGSAIPNIVVSFLELGQELHVTDGRHQLQLDEGTYGIQIEAEGYVTYYANVEIAEAETTHLSVVLVRAGSGSVSGKVVSATTGLALPGVSLAVRAGVNVTSGDIVATGQTGTDGAYAMTLDAGYYTVEMTLEGYTTGYFSFQIDGNESVTAHGSLSPIMSGNTYRVVLTWGASPRDLDSHLCGTAGDGTEFSIYFGKKQAYRKDGSEIGNLDVDDISGYGPETTTFYVDTEGSYYFYVYRYSSSGSLPDSGAKVEVYNGDRLVASYSINPAADDSYRYWNVFQIKNGIYQTVDSMSNSAMTNSAAVSILSVSADSAQKE